MSFLEDTLQLSILLEKTDLTNRIKDEEPNEIEKI